MLFTYVVNVYSDMSLSKRFYDFSLNSYRKWDFSLCHKVGQGQPRFIICTNLVGPTFPMLHTKSEGHWPPGSRGEDFQRVFTIYGRGGHLGIVTSTIGINFG